MSNVDRIPAGWKKRTVSAKNPPVSAAGCCSTSSRATSSPLGAAGAMSCAVLPAGFSCRLRGREHDIKQSMQYSRSCMPRDWIWRRVLRPPCSICLKKTSPCPATHHPHDSDQPSFLTSQLAFRLRRLLLAGTAKTSRRTAWNQSETHRRRRPHRGGDRKRRNEDS